LLQHDCRCSPLKFGVDIGRRRSPGIRLNIKNRRFAIAHSTTACAGSSGRDRTCRVSLGTGGQASIRKCRPQSAGRMRVDSNLPHPRPCARETTPLLSNGREKPAARIVSRHPRSAQRGRVDGPQGRSRVGLAFRQPSPSGPSAKASLRSAHPPPLLHGEGWVLDVRTRHVPGHHSIYPAFSFTPPWECSFAAYQP